MGSEILLVEDEADLAGSLRRALEQEGYRVTLACDGRQASRALGLDGAEGSRFDGVILDWMLPYCSGLEICQQLRQRQDPTPVLFLTAKDTLDDRVHGLDAGADDYLVKPFELRELLARVRALLRRPQRQEVADTTSQKIRAGGWELDSMAQVVRRDGGQEIQLSEKESQLLGLFLLHPDQLLTHEQIYDHLWPSEARPSSNILAAQVRLLRRKLEPSVGDTPGIQTVYRKGYRFSG